MKRKGIMIVAAVAILLSSCCTGTAIKHPYTQEYTPGEVNIQGDVDVDFFESADSRFAIGADEDGKAVFKDPEKAFEALKEKYADGIELIREQYGLAPLSQSNYKDYSVLDVESSAGTKEQRVQANFVTSFMDIYENSFE